MSGDTLLIQPGPEL